MYLYAIVLFVLMFVVAIMVISIAMRPRSRRLTHSNYNSSITITSRYRLDPELVYRQMDLTSLASKRLTSISPKKWTEVLKGMSDRELGINLLISDYSMNLMSTNLKEPGSTRALQAIAGHNIASISKHDRPYRLIDDSINNELMIAFTQPIAVSGNNAYNCTGVIEVPLILRSIEDRILPLNTYYEWTNNVISTRSTLLPLLTRVSSIIDYIHNNGLDKLFKEYSSNPVLRTAIIDADGDELAGNLQNTYDKSLLSATINSINCDCFEIHQSHPYLTSDGKPVAVLIQLYGGSNIPSNSKMFILAE